MSDHPTDPPPPNEQAPEEEYVVPAGRARITCVAALANLAHAVGQCSQLMEAMARALDNPK